MEKINLVELLKDCPKGMELYSPIFGKVYLDEIRPHLAIVVTTEFYREEFLYDGRYGMNGECMLFPSKGKTTWEGFVPPVEFKDGDIVACVDDDKGYTQLFIYKEMIDAKEGYSVCYMMLDYDGCLDLAEGDYYIQRLATEEEKQKLLQAIKANGYKWNSETKTLEKLVTPKFKVGNKVRNKNNHNVVFTISGIEDDSYICGSKAAFWFDDQDNYELVPDKFDISKLIPFESRVLVRDYNCDIWKVSFWGTVVDIYGDYKYDTVRGQYKQCIPYEGNEHLLGTTDDCDDFYKNWDD